MSLPNGWISVKFTDVLDVQGGTQPPKSQFINESCEGYVRLLQIRDFGEKPVSTYIPDTSKLKKVTKDDVLIGRYGASVGRICTGMEGAYNVALAKVLKTDDINNKYLRYFLLSSLFQMPLSLISRSAQNGFNKQDLSGIDFLLPPLNEQKRIAKKLDELLANVESIKTRLDNVPRIIKRFRQSILSTSTSGKLTEEWRRNNIKEQKIKINEITQSWINTYKEDGKKYPLLNLEVGDTTYDNLPKTWNKTQLGYVFDVYVGATPSRKNEAFWNGNIPWVSSGEVAFNSIYKTKEYITEDGLNNTSTNIHPVGTILLAMIGQGKTRGQPAILEIEACHNQNTAALRVNDKYSNSKYLYYYLWERYEKTREIGSGNNQKALNKKAVQSLPFPLPPLAEQKEIVSQVESLFRLADTFEEKIEAAKKRIDKLTQSILSKAFKGELVTQDPSDEPAEELLKRIKAEQQKEKTKKNRNKKTTTLKVKCLSATDLLNTIDSKFKRNDFTISDIQNVTSCTFDDLTNYLFELIENDLIVMKTKNNQKVYKIS